MRIIAGAASFVVLSLLSTLPAQVPSVEPPALVPQPSVTGGPEKVPEVPASGAHPLTKSDLEAWLDGFMPYALERGDVAGATISVVQNGQLLLAKGYGYADVAAHKPVDPERTLFRAGSVSKLFTWTAVMQLVEQRKLNLDTDVNTYLDFKIPPRDGPPITLRNLMTHTPGFDEFVRALIVAEGGNIPTLEQALKRWVPPRVTAAGSTPAYSNYGAALAGYIVQRISGRPFDDYIEQEIFAPLGMQHATFRQPLPQKFVADMSKGYQLGSGEPKPFEIVTVAPAGSISISGADMAPFMIAHLQNGAFGSTRILQEATAVQMHSTRANVIPPLNPMLLGFYENDINGRRIISHGGDTEFFHSDLNLFPDDNVGFFVSFNSAGKEGAAHVIRPALLQEFCRRYFPGPVASGTVDADTAKAHAKLIAGRYTATRGAHTSFLSLLGLLGEVAVTANSDATISVALLRGANDQPKKWKEIAPFVWVDPDSGGRIAAQVENGHVIRFGYDAYPFMLFEPVAASRSAGWLLPLLLTALAALTLTVLAWPIAALVRKRYGVRYELTGTDARAHRLIRIASLLLLAVIIGWAVLIGLIGTTLAWAGPGTDIWIITLRLFSAVIFVGAALIALWNAWTVITSNRRKLAKLWSVVLAVSCVALLYAAILFHLPGFTANY